MADTTKTPADKKPKEPVVEEPPKWAASPDFFQSQAQALYGSPYSTSSKRGYGYYGQTAEPARKTALATTLGISTAGAVVEGLISASRMFDSGIKYAERELAEAEGIQREPTPKMTEDEKYEIRTASLAPARAEAAEIKSDVGALMASRGGATVADLLRVRESGTETLATAGLEAEAAIGKKELQGQQKHDQRVQMAQQRADQMTQTLFEARQEGRDHKAGLIRDITKVAAEVAAEWPSEDDRPAMDRMLEGNMTMDEITKIHEKAVYSAFRPGTHAYNTYMMAAYSDWKEEQPEPTKRTADVPVAGQPAAVAPAPAAISFDAAWARVSTGVPAAKTQEELQALATAAKLERGQYEIVETRKEGGARKKGWLFELKLKEGVTKPEAPAADAPAADAPAADAQETPQAKAQRQITGGFVLPKKDALVAMATTAGLKPGEYTIELEEPVEKGSGIRAAYKIVLKKGVELPALEAVASAETEGEKAELTKFETHDKFWTGPDQGRKEADGFRKWVLSENPEYATKVPKMGNMLGTDTLSPSGSFDAKNRTFSSVWDKHGAEYLKWKATQSTAK